MGKSLPRSIDVQIQVSKAQTETRTALDLMCVVCKDAFPSGGDVVRIYSTMDAVAVDFTSGQEGYLAAQAFFSQTPRANTLALGHWNNAKTAAENLDAIQAAANLLGVFIYGWTLGATLRDVTDQAAAAVWALSQEKAVMVLCTNSTDALNGSLSSDIGSVVKATGNRRAVVLYHDNVLRYPDVSILAYMLHVNYQMKDSTVTAKFKVLPGIETVSLTPSQWGVLNAKGYNTYTAVGNNARTFRDGDTEDTTWYLDTLINIDNFVEDLSVAVFNVFLRNKKVPYTKVGQMMLMDAALNVGSQYTYNGSFAPRDMADTSVKAGYRTVKAVEIIPTPIYNMSASDRAQRVGPPMQIIVQDSGAIHSVAINVEVVS